MVTRSLTLADRRLESRHCKTNDPHYYVSTHKPFRTKLTDIHSTFDTPIVLLCVRNRTIRQEQSPLALSGTTTPSLPFQPTTRQWPSKKGLKQGVAGQYLRRCYYKREDVPEPSPPPEVFWSAWVAKYRTSASESFFSSSKAGKILS